MVEAAAAPGAEAALPAAILRRRLRAGPQARRRGARAARPRRSWRGHTATTRATICDDVPQDSASCKIDRYRKRNARPGPRTTSEVVLCNKTTIALYATNEQQYATRSLLSRQELAGRPGGSTHSLTARLDNWAIDLRSLLPAGRPMGGVATVTVTAARATTSASAASAVGETGWTSGGWWDRPWRK